MVFLEAESCGLIPREGSNWGKRSTQPGDLPPDLNVLRLPRPVNTDAPDFPLRHTASQIAASFFSDMILTTLNSISITYYVSSIKYSLAIPNT